MTEQDGAATAMADTVDLRSGAPVDESLLALLPLLGIWQGSGVGRDPLTGEQYDFAQVATIAHDGRPFLVYESRTWVLGADGAIGLPAHRECGFWRAGAAADDVELAITTGDGQALLFAGAEAERRYELSTTATSAVASVLHDAATPAQRRLYSVEGDELSYAIEIEVGESAQRPGSNAKLVRVRAAADPDPDEGRGQRRSGR